MKLTMRHYEEGDIDKLVVRKRQQYDYRNFKESIDYLYNAMDWGLPLITVVNSNTGTVLCVSVAKPLCNPEEMTEQLVTQCDVVIVNTLIGKYFLRHKKEIYLISIAFCEALRKEYKEVYATAEKTFKASHKYLKGVGFTYFAKNDFLTIYKYK